MKTEETIHTLALTRIPGLGLIGARHLLQAAGHATILFRHSKQRLWESQRCSVQPQCLHTTPRRSRCSFR